MKLLAVVLLGLLASVLAEPARQLRTIGPDDVAAAAAVGEAVVMHDVGAKKAAAHIAKAKAHEAYMTYKADKKVARAVQHALKHAGGHAEHTAALAEGGMLPAAIASGLETAKVSVHDGRRIAKAMAHAQHVKSRAKAHTIKVVVKSVGEAAATDLQYGGKAAAAVGNAALHDFAPLLSGLAPQFLPQLTNLAGLGPAGLTNVLGGLASAIGGALTGGPGALGVAGPSLLASRVATLLPEDLLQSLVGAVSPLGGAGPAAAASGLESLVQNMSPEALELIVNFLSGGAGASSVPSTFRQVPNLPNLGTPPLPTLGLPGLPSLPNPLKAVDDLIHLPEHVLQALLRSVTNLMTGNGGQQHGPFHLPQLPSGGLPMPLRAISNLLGVLPRPDLQNILRLLPRNPLANLVGGLPLGVMEE